MACAPCQKNRVTLGPAAKQVPLDAPKPEELKSSLDAPQDAGVTASSLDGPQAAGAPVVENPEAAENQPPELPPAPDTTNEAAMLAPAGEVTAPAPEAEQSAPSSSSTDSPNSETASA